MKKTEKKTIEVDVYYSDISGRKIEEYNEHFYHCVRCGKHFADGEAGETQDDGSLCEVCSEQGYEFKYSSDGTVGIVDSKGKYVTAPWL